MDRIHGWIEGYSQGGWTMFMPWKANHGTSLFFEASVIQSVVVTSVCQSPLCAEVFMFLDPGPPPSRTTPGSMQPFSSFQPPIAEMLYGHCAYIVQASRCTLTEWPPVAQSVLPATLTW